MKRLELTVTMNSADGKSVLYHQRIESDELFKLLTIFPLLIAQMHRRLLVEESNKAAEKLRESGVISDADDIPF